MLILTEPLNHGGRLYAIGEDVRGKLPLDLIQQLQDGGYIEEQAPESDPVTADGDPDSGPNEGEQKLTPEDLAEDGKPVRGRRNG
ncbi:hypothetical protein [Paenibacillus graminis]|uniref:hypothetical protein n=1 Tax=Paenibacillus graminis TaxID=189425 RepID=UPI002DBE9C33|nr:hypothetical protein [Paenibacillus graminis]MEC0171161.1 hypothetical protein [Paenibacillus graminis]